MTTNISINEQIAHHVDDGDLIGAVRLLNTYALEPGDFSSLTVAGRVMRLRGRYSDALWYIERALSANRDYVPALVERARLAVGAGEPGTAQIWYKQAYEKTLPGQEWVLEWIELMVRVNESSEGLDVAARFCEAASDNALGWFYLGLMHQRESRHTEALLAYDRAKQLDPTVPMLSNNVAAAHLELGDLSQAQSVLEDTLKREATNEFAWNNLSLALLKQGDLVGAEVAAERACTLAPDFPLALSSYSYVLKERQQWDAALLIASRALKRDPDNPSLIWAIAMLQLLRGDYVNGWVNYEARWQGAPELSRTMRNLPSPCWTGESLSGKTLFVWDEQGDGDAIQFMRFVPAIAERVSREGGKFIYCCHAHLKPLFERSLMGLVEAIVPRDISTLPSHDFNLPIGSLPLMLDIALEQLPWKIDYLLPDSRTVKRWKKKLGDRKGRLRVGLVWNGNPTGQSNSLQSIDPAAYARAFKHIKAIEFVNLQLDADLDVETMRGLGLSIVDLTADLKSYDDTAALLATLDFVVTVCSSVAHVAGALGVPTWLLLPVNPHWVWLTERTDSPWYPSVTLYRQEEYLQWDPVLERVANHLERRAAMRQHK